MNRIDEPGAAHGLAGNPLRTRADLEAAMLALFQPLRRYFSPGRARVRLSAEGAHFDRAAADLEGFARPLWGLASAAAGGSKLDMWDLYREGLANGTDPDHSEYWGRAKDRDQRLVEHAALGFALHMAPHELWDPQPQPVRDRIARYLLDAREREHVRNNWMFFRVLVDLGLARVGIPYDQALTRDYLDRLDAFHIAGGWYRDGDVRRIDHYVPFAIHYYGLIYAAAKTGTDDPYALRYRDRAAQFAHDLRHWFDDEGGALAFGRSMTYRFACGGFWSALPFAGVEALPWGVVKGYLLRHLRWWASQPMADRDGMLGIGYGYPNLLMSEQYNSAGSPYWAFKAFLALALPDTHPFWQADEIAAPPSPPIVAQRHPGFVLMPARGNVTALSSGQENRDMRAGSEKYAKFAYASRYGFSVESDPRGFDRLAAFDNMLAFSEDGRHYRVRERNEEALLDGTTLYARWLPWPDVTVETWLVPAPPWHIRIHRITTPRALLTAEGGFAIARTDGDADQADAGQGFASIATATDFTGIRDLGSSIERTGRAQTPAPNTNLITARSWVPQLRGELPPGTHRLVTAVLAQPGSAPASWGQPPHVPTPNGAGIRVSAIEVDGVA